jgi:hypothetical protein
MVYFRELNYLPSSRFSDFVGSSREKKKKEEIIVFTKQFLPFIHDKLQRSKIKFHVEYILGGYSSFSGEHPCASNVQEVGSQKRLDES